ncbi:MAG: hypothetical protein PWQ62_858 [Candidatus Methanomethylophilaceae archaeon]|nr:hypothetical protein [Candidatus Methanomethylophilaceae archaeon]
MDISFCGEEYGQASVRAVAVLSVLLLFLPPAPPSTSGQIASITIEFEFPMVEISDDPLCPFVVEGFPSGVPGSSPYALPMTSQLVELPAEVLEVRDISISSSEPLFLGDFDLSPLVYSNGIMSVDDVKRTSLAYMGSLIWNEEPVLPLAVTPIQIVEGTAYFHSKVSVKISYTVSDSGPTAASTETNMLPPAVRSAGEYDMLIITSSNLEDQFHRLQQWRNMLGISTVVVNTSYIAASFPGVPLKEAIRSFVWNQYNVSSISYLLLGGGKNIIPVHTVNLNASYFSENIPTDMYYGAFDPVDWSKGFDPFAELMVGRVPVSTASAASNYVDKVINYESRMGRDSLSEVLFIGERLDDTVWGGDIKDTNTVYVPDSYNLTKLYEREEGVLGLSTVSSALRNAHLVNHMGHGDYDVLCHLQSSNVASVDNEMPYIIYSQACNVGGFDKQSCVSVAMLSDEGNSVANIVNSRFGWYISGSDYAEGPSNLFDKAFMERVFTNGGFLGDIHQSAKESQAANLSNPYISWVYASLNLLGDPALKVGGYDEVPSFRVKIDDDGDLLDLAHKGFIEGEGTEVEPFIISGIQGGESMISLHNTSLHVRISGNLFSCVGTAISLNNSSNVTVEGNTFNSNELAIGATSSVITVKDNRFNDNDVCLLSQLSQVLFKNNSIISGNEVGIDSCGSSLTVEENVFSRCGSHAIRLVGNGSNLSGNSFVDCNGSDIWEKGEQAFDEGENHWEGNWWSDHRDGSPYRMGGGGIDLSPLTTNVNDAPIFIASIPSSFYSTTALNLTATSAEDIESYWAGTNGSMRCMPSATPLAGDLEMSYGQNVLAVKAYSGEGNLGVLVQSIEYLTDLPHVIISRPISQYVRESPFEVLWESESDQSDPIGYSYSVDGGEYNDNRLSTSLSLALDDGPHTIRVRAYYNDGNFSSAGTSFFIDTKAPFFELHSPKEGRTLASSEILLSWTSYDLGSPPSGISLFEIEIDGVLFTPPLNSRSLTLDLDDGNHTLFFIVHDCAGNNVSLTRSFSVDSEMPQISIDTPPGYPMVGVDPTIHWSVGDSGGVKRVLLRIDGGAPFDVTCKSSKTLRGLSEGYHLIELIAIDTAGRVGHAEIGLVTGSSDRILDLTSPIGDVAAGSLNISWELWGADEATFGCMIDGESYLLGTARSMEVELNEGKHRVLLWAEADGMNISRSATICVIAGTPSLISSLPENGSNEALFDDRLLFIYDKPDDIDRLLTQVILLDSDGCIVNGKVQWTREGSLYFCPSYPLEYPQDFTAVVRLVDKAGGVREDLVNFSTKSVTVPGKPVNLQVHTSANWAGPFAILSWDAPYDNGGHPSPLIYSVYRNNGEGWEKIGESVRRTYIDRDVNAGIDYVYYITASNAVGEGGPSLLSLSVTAAEVGEWEAFLSSVAFIWQIYQFQIDVGVDTIHEITQVLDEFAESFGYYTGQMGVILQDLMLILWGKSVSFLVTIFSLWDGIISYTLWIALAFIALAGLFLFIVIKRKIEITPPSTKTTDEMIDSMTFDLLQERMIELDQMYEGGELDEDEYRLQREDLAKRLLAVHLAAIAEKRRKF